VATGQAFKKNAGDCRSRSVGGYESATFQALYGLCDDMTIGRPETKPGQATSLEAPAPVSFQPTALTPCR